MYTVAMITEKWCRRCHVVKSIEEFSKNIYIKDGFQSYCKPCNKEAGKEYRRKKGLSTRRKIGKRRGAVQILEKDYQQYMSDANYACSNIFCDSAERLSLDHNHDTGEIRGVLCGTCNTALGMIGDSVLRLQGLIEYLERS